MWAGRCCGSAELEYYVGINWYGPRSYCRHTRVPRVDNSSSWVYTVYTTDWHSDAETEPARPLHSLQSFSIRAVIYTE